ncbi:MAG: hypothetical protein KDA69_09055 [Planctomycetaceae bacterium]|nr:hypothetical protein [Planctomycetaceae bacterium]
MLLRSLSVAVICLSLASVTYGQNRSFPYEATVAVDDVEVRCGPGQRYYVTSKLKAGTRLTVHRHDHGGWFMIAPPPGSFSLIDADYVDVNGNRGTVSVAPVEAGQQARVVVRIGSEVSDDHAYFGRQLANGDGVQILGRKTLQTERGLREMLQIVPPSQEFRWIKGDFVVPIDTTVRAEQANDPYQIPPQHRANMTREELVVASGTEETRTASEPKSSPEAAELMLLDQRYAAMMSKEPMYWDLNGLTVAYQDLLGRSAPEQQATIQRRLQVIESRRSIHQQFQRFVSLANETSQRDAQLATMQPGSAPIANGQFPVTTPNTFSQFDSSAFPQTASADNSNFNATGADVQPNLNGAGIVQPLGVAGMPPYALVAPDGRFLAYLEPADPQQLRSWVGKETGVIGQRAFDPRLNADLIRVRRVQSVRLVTE